MNIYFIAVFIYINLACRRCIHLAFQLHTAHDLYIGCLSFFFLSFHRPKRRLRYVCSMWWRGGFSPQLHKCCLTYLIITRYNLNRIHIFWQDWLFGNYFAAQKHHYYMPQSYFFDRKIFYKRFSTGEKSLLELGWNSFSKIAFQAF